MEGLLFLHSQSGYHDEAQKLTDAVSLTEAKSSLYFVIGASGIEDLHYITYASVSHSGYVPALVASSQTKVKVSTQ